MMFPYIICLYLMSLFIIIQSRFLQDASNLKVIEILDIAQITKFISVSDLSASNHFILIEIIVSNIFIDINIRLYWTSSQIDKLEH